VIPIPRRLMTFLRHARAHAAGDHVIACDGRPVASIKRSFATACRGAGLVRGDPPAVAADGRNRRREVSPHTLRHTSIIWLVQRGVPLWEVAGFVGATVDTIERVYGHHAPDYLDRARRALD
jgi:integrase